MAYKVIILYRLYMPSYFLGTFTEYPSPNGHSALSVFLISLYLSCYRLLFLNGHYQRITYFLSIILQVIGPVFCFFETIFAPA